MAASCCRFVFAFSFPASVCLLPVAAWAGGRCFHLLWLRTQGVKGQQMRFLFFSCKSMSKPSPPAVPCMYVCMYVCMYFLRFLLVSGGSGIQSASIRALPISPVGLGRCRAGQQVARRFSSRLHCALVIIPGGIWLRFILRLFFVYLSSRCLGAFLFCTVCAGWLLPMHGPELHGQELQQGVK